MRLMECFCIHFKIASLLLSFPSKASWKDSNELETPCLPWHSGRTCQHIPWPWHSLTNLISTSAMLSWLHCSFVVHHIFNFTQICFWLSNCNLTFSPSRLSLEDTQQWSQSLERLLESKCRLLFPRQQEYCKNVKLCLWEWLFNLDWWFYRKGEVEGLFCS